MLVSLRSSITLHYSHPRHLSLATYFVIGGLHWFRSIGNMLTIPSPNTSLGDKNYELAND